MVVVVVVVDDCLILIWLWTSLLLVYYSHNLYVYPRILTEQEKKENKLFEIYTIQHPNIIRCEAPVMKISSSFIRKAISENKDVRYLLTPEVFKYVDEMRFYKKK